MWLFGMITLVLSECTEVSSIWHMARDELEKIVVEGKGIFTKRFVLQLKHIGRHDCIWKIISSLKWKSLVFAKPWEEIDSTCFFFVAEEAYHPPTSSFKLFQLYHHGEGKHKQWYHKTIFQRGWCGSIAEESETYCDTSAGGWCGKSATIVFGGWHTGPLYGNRGGQPKVDRADRGLAERGVNSIQESDHDQVGWWICGRLCQQNQAVGWISRVQVRFPDTVSIRLQQAPNIEALTMGNLIFRARVLTIEEWNQFAPMRSPHSSSRNSSSTNVTCYRCNIKGLLAKDCWKHKT